MPKPSKMKRTGKAVAKKKNGYKKAKTAASKFGGGLGKNVGSISKRRKALQKALKELG
jgi:hypothetical protein